MAQFQLHTWVAHWGVRRSLLFGGPSQRCPTPDESSCESSTGTVIVMEGVGFGGGLYLWTGRAVERLDSSLRRRRSSRWMDGYCSHVTLRPGVHMYVHTRTYLPYHGIPSHRTGAGLLFALRDRLSTWEAVVERRCPNPDCSNMRQSLYLSKVHSR